MNIVLAALASTLAAIAAAGTAVTITGRRQPSRPIHRQERVIFAALRHNDPSIPVQVEDVLWTSTTLFTLVGEGEAYWTHFAILPQGSPAVSRLTAQPGVTDLFVAEIELTNVPSAALGMLRLRHRLGLTRRPKGPLPTTLDHVEGRRDVLPTLEAIGHAQALPRSMQVTMVNFLEYPAITKGDAADGRAAYLRYGRQAMRAVHGVGGQFLFAGQITSVLAAPESPAWQEPWDDLAAMIYPDPTAIFAMEQFPFYRRALGDRDEGLKRTRVIVTRAY
ncbi:hypothetical protein [Qipengyuania sp. ASV99]|uniref:hypothetical protein n=1 Tax=Qipengyuania sp. ASV99 TaxID=3399681 RepID=UPI003A4C6DD2